MIDGLTIDWRWDDFTPWELRDDRMHATADSFRVTIEPETVDRLQRLRTHLGFPLVINSAYRSPTYNTQVAHTGRNGPHTTARAFDIKIYGYRAYELIDAAPEFGFTGIGQKQHGPRELRMVHIDDLPEIVGVRPRPWVWTYS